MAEWFVEDGIGEQRAILVEDDEIVAARLEWPGRLAAGLVAQATLVSRIAGSSRGTARFPSGEEALVDRLPKSAREGGAINLEVIRPAMAERGRLKRAQARPTECPARPAPSLADRLAQEGHEVRLVHRFPVSGWGELMADAVHGEVAFTGGTLQFSLTPAMLLIDVDGTLDPRSLALSAAQPLANALRRFDIGGSIGIDFPSLSDKADRRAVDEGLANALNDWPHERTAMNGFGFVQLVVRLERPSFLHRATHERSAMAARLLLRQAERLEGAGALMLTSHPAVDAQLADEWLSELARRTGREVRRTADPALAIAAPHAQLVPR